MTLPRTDRKKFERFALLARQPVEIAHPTIKGHRVIGWLIEPDENYSVPDGIGMIEAIERLFRMCREAVRLTMLKRL